MPPVAVVEDGIVYLSRNGATRIAGWEIFAGTARGELKAVATVKSTGFETEFKLANGAKFVKAAAYREGRALKFTNVIAVD